LNKTLHLLALLSFMVANVSAYPLHGRTALGLPAGPKSCAVNTRVIPLRSKVRVAGKWYYASDRTRRGGNAIDIWKPSIKQCRLFGRHKMRVEVIKYRKSGNHSRHRSSN
jgi:3D (Asp-Asp-Asp) domain-containing protein